MGLGRLVKKIAAIAMRSGAKQVERAAFNLRVLNTYKVMAREENKQEANTRLTEAFKEGLPITIEDALRYDSDLNARLQSVLTDDRNTQFHLRTDYLYNGYSQNILGRDSRCRTVLLSGPITDVAYLKSFELLLCRDRLQNHFDTEAIFKLATFLTNNVIKIQKEDLKVTKFASYEDVSIVPRLELVAELCRVVLKINSKHPGALQLLAECYEGCGGNEKISIQEWDLSHTLLHRFSSPEIESRRKELVTSLKEKADSLRQTLPGEKSECLTAFLNHIQKQASKVRVEQEEILKKLEREENGSQVVVPKGLK